MSNFWVELTGEDVKLVRRCGDDIIRKFSSIGKYIGALLVLSFISSWLFFSHVFSDFRLAALPLAIFWTATIFNYYLLILYTITPHLLPSENKKTKSSSRSWRSFLDLSNLLRVSLILGFGIITAQSIIVELFSGSYEEGDHFVHALSAIYHSPILAVPAVMIDLVFSILFIYPIIQKYLIRDLSQENFERDLSEGKVTSKELSLKNALARHTDYENLKAEVQNLDLSNMQTTDYYYLRTLHEYKTIITQFERFRTEYVRTLRNQCTSDIQRIRQNLAPELTKLESIDWNAARKIHRELDYQESKAASIEYECAYVDPPFRLIRKSELPIAGDRDTLINLLYPQE